MTAFDLTPLATHADVTDHVHLLRVTATWWCESESCEGYATALEDHDLEFEYELEHPEACPVPACCCKWPEGPSQIDPNCSAGQHDACLNVTRCWTERELSDGGLETFEFPTVTATYRIQAWGHRDYWGEYDGGIEFEQVTEQVTEEVGAS